MKKKITLIILVFMMLCACSETEEINESLTLCEQTIEQLQLEETEINQVYIPINFEKQKSVWFTMMDFENALKYKSESEFTDYIGEVFEKIKNTGFNTVYVHVRPYNNAYYKSDIFPIINSMPSEFDPFEIILTKAHCLNLSVHAWVNPLRCQTESEIKSLDDNYKIKEWYNLENDFISLSDDRYYLNPAHEEVRDYIKDGILEIIKDYNVDGIHIDDYFYPTQEKNFDKNSFEKSGETDLKKWRTENVNLMVSEVYDIIKQENEDILFGISPQGNISINTSNLYADVTKWCSEEGFCDYIVPQLYYGFKNENKPFKETFSEWKNILLCDKVKLVAGVCMYKIGIEDKWAGDGKNEWIEDKNIPSRQIEYVLENNCSIAVYSVETLLDSKNSEECQLIKKLLEDL